LLLFVSLTLVVAIAVVALVVAVLPDLRNDALVVSVDSSAIEEISEADDEDVLLATRE